jgi:thiamine pyrophosphokinase
MKNVLISLSGKCSTNHNLKIIEFTDIVGVDGGTQHLIERSITPSVVLGDLDSIEPVLLKKIKSMNINFISYESDKDKTDFELSLDNIEKPSEKNIFLIGGEEGEVDHLFSIFSLVTNFEYSENLTWFYQEKTILFRKNITIEIEKGSNFSIIPITDLKSLNILGAEWELNQEDIKAGSSKTLRNLAKRETVSINCEDGLFSLIY